MPRLVFYTWVVALLTSTHALALDVRRHSIPSNLRPIFQQVERDLEDMAKKNTATAHRVSELEGDLRKARSRITRLETDLTILKLKLGVRRDVATPPKPKAGPGDTKSPATPPTGTTPKTGVVTRPKKPPTVPQPKTLVKISDEKRTAEGQFVVVTGKVANTSDRPLTFVVIETTFLDRKGSTVTTASAYTTPRVLAPGATASFRVMTRADERIAGHKTRVRTD